MGLPKKKTELTAEEKVELLTAALKDVDRILAFEGFYNKEKFYDWENRHPEALKLVR